MKNEELLQLANKFDELAGKFEKFIADNKLQNTEVDMKESEDLRREHKNLCDTPACHGGWASIMFGLEGEPGDDSFYKRGAEKITKFLGFSNKDDLSDWAYEYPLLWGNIFGANMFSDQIAFTPRDSDTITLPEIPAWYRGVAKRIREHCEIFKLLSQDRSKWFRGFLWAEELRQREPRQWVEMIYFKVAGSMDYNDFDRGAEAYITYWKGRYDNRGPKLNGSRGNSKAKKISQETPANSIHKAAEKKKRN